MSHELRIRNGVADMAYAGELAWHGFGQKLEPNAPIEDWIKAANMDYQIVEATAGFKVQEVFHLFNARKILYRSDDFTPLGIVSKQYKVVQPSEVVEFYRDLCSDYGFVMETCGVLKEGAVYWALAKTGQVMYLKGDDKIDAYMLLSTSADGTRATEARFTSVRVVCNNTLSIATRNNKDTTIKVRHNTFFNDKHIKQQLGIVDYESSWTIFKEQMEQLCNTSVDKEKAEEFLSKLIRPSDENVFNKNRAVRGLEDLKNSYYLAPGAQPGTAYGLVQAVTHFVDHTRGSDKNRLYSAWFAQGNNLKNQALEEALVL